MKRPDLFAIASVVGRYVPAGASDIRLANVAFRRGRPPPAAVRVLRCGTRVILDPSDWPQAEAWVLGRYDIPSVQFIVDRLPEHGGVFFDVGGHVGLISCQVAARRSGVMIHGFEPHPRVAPMYKRNTALNAVSAVLTEAAASSSEGSVVFNLDSHAIGRGNVTIPTLRLDDYIKSNSIERIDVMKLDVEGHERETLEGARRALETGVIRAVTMEAMTAHGQDTTAPARLLMSLGFQPRRLPDVRPSWVRRIRGYRCDNIAYVRSSA